MKEIRVLIVENQAEEANNIKEILEENGYVIAGICTTAIEAEKTLNTISVDICILDIFLGKDTDGIWLAEKISEMNIPFLFLTGSKDREVFEKARLTRPSSYLLKPFNALELSFSIELAIEKFFDQPHTFSLQSPSAVLGNPYLFVKNKDRISKIAIDDIAFIEVEDRYCKIVYEEHQYLIKMSLKKAIELFPSFFIQTHRNCLVNLHKIKDIFPNDNLIVMTSGANVLLSERFKHKILKKLKLIN